MKAKAILEMFHDLEDSFDSAKKPDKTDTITMSDKRFKSPNGSINFCFKKGLITQKDAVEAWAIAKKLQLTLAKKSKKLTFVNIQID
jgi:hypothetical protein